MWNTVASLLIGLGTFGAFVMGVFNVLKGRQNGSKLDEASSHLSEIHVLVNSQLSAALLRVDQLVNSMQQANVEIPAPVPKDPNNTPPIKIVPVQIGNVVEPMVIVTAPQETES